MSLPFSQPLVVFQTKVWGWESHIKTKLERIKISYFVLNASEFTFKLSLTMKTRAGEPYKNKVNTFQVQF